MQYEQRNTISQNHKFQTHLAWEGDNKNIQQVIKKYSTVPTAASYCRSHGFIHPVHSYHSWEAPGGAEVNIIASSEHKGKQTHQSLAQGHTLNQR